MPMSYIPKPKELSSESALAIIKDALEQHKEQLRVTGKLDGLCNLIDQSYKEIEEQLNYTPTVL